ncbi:unnamed protein product, partial [Hapterophycus canaliculatus]
HFDGRRGKGRAAQLTGYLFAAHRQLRLESGPGGAVLPQLSGPDCTRLHRHQARKVLRLLPASHAEPSDEKLERGNERINSLFHSCCRFLLTCLAPRWGVTRGRSGDVCTDFGGVVLGLIRLASKACTFFVFSLKP